MTEEQFWRCTPLKLNELFRIHKEVEGVENSKESDGYIDEILF
jgi:hypothetical protein